MVALFWEFIFGPTFPQKFTSSHQYHFTFFFFFFFSPQTFYFSLLRGGTSPNWIYMLGDYPLFTISKNIYINYIKIDLTRNIWNHIGTDFNTIQSWKLSNQSQQVARNPSGLPRLSTAPDRQWCAIGSAPQSQRSTSPLVLPWDRVVHRHERDPSCSLCGNSEWDATVVLK